MAELIHRSCGVSPQAVKPASCRLPRRAAPTGFLLGILVASLALLLSLPAPAQDSPTTRVGLPITLTDIYIPGGEVRPKPRPDREPPIVIRLLAVKPAQDGKRYDLEVYGLEPGDYDLATFLEPVDPANPPRFPKIPLTVTTDLPPGLPRPAELPSTPPSKVGGYQTALWVFGILWLLGLIAIILWRKRGQSPKTSAQAPPSLAERLRDLLTQASQDNLSNDQKAALERLILGHWRKRLPELAKTPSSHALSTLRQHPEAGPLLRQLEEWLHKPDTQISNDQLDALLAPYQDAYRQAKTEN